MDHKGGSTTSRPAKGVADHPQGQSPLLIFFFLLFCRCSPHGSQRWFDNSQTSQGCLRQNGVAEPPLLLDFFFFNFFHFLFEVLLFYIILKFF